MERRVAVLIPAIILAAMAFGLSAFAQQPAPIQDNSFLVEEAYNQDAGVVQHINTFTRFANGDWAYTFTQEWPAPGRPRHQLSYSLAILSPGIPTGAGVGDSMLNYRYQLLGNEASRVAFAPRVTLIAPTGSVRLGRGTG